MYSVEDLVAYVNIVEEGSVTSAAKSMDLDPATVSRRLSKLETKLGATLIKRSTRRMAITTEGRVFFSQAVAALGMLRQAEQAVKAASEACESDALSIAGPGWLLQQQLVPVLHKCGFSKNASLELLATDSVEALPSRGMLNISVGQFTVASEHQVCLQNNRTVLCSAPSYLGRVGGINTPSDLIGKVTIAPKRESQWRFKPTVDGVREVEAGDGLHCDDPELLLSLAKAGYGVVALNSVQAEAAMSSGALVEVLEGLLVEDDKNIYLHCDANNFSRERVSSCFRAIEQAISARSVKAGCPQASTSLY